jgi:hypothetical protein
MLHARIAARAFNTPLLVEPTKAMAFLSGLGPRIPAATLRRLWTMLAHVQGGLLNAAALAEGLAVSGQTVGR